MEDNNINDALEFGNELGDKEREELAASIYGNDLFPSFEKINQQYRDFYRLAHLLTIRLTALYEGGNDCSSTLEAVDDLYDETQSNTWIDPFLKDNKEVFSIVQGLQVQKPKFYYSLDEKGRKNYDDARRYYIDTTNLQSAFKHVCRLMGAVHNSLRLMFRLSYNSNLWIDNGYNDSLYKKIDSYFSEFNDFLRWGYDRIEDEALISKRFYINNSGKLDDGALKDGYLAKRWEDFDLWVKRCCGKFISGNGKSKYSVNSTLKMWLHNIDRGTSITAETCEDLSSAAYEVDTIIKRAEDVEKAINGMTGFNNDGSRIVANEFLALAGVCKAFASKTKEHMDGYMNKMDRAPYCFMKMVPNYKSVDPKGFGYSLPTAEPRKDGTAYVAAFIEMCRVTNKFAEEFVNNHGTYFKK